MGRALADVCLDIASFAKERKHDFLSYILRLAAAEAYKTTTADDIFELPIKRKLPSRELIAGIWDWDIPGDRAYFDRASAEFFNIDPGKAARGVSNDEVVRAIHPDDIGRVLTKVSAALRVGGPYECEYRLIKNDRVVWVFARGACTLDHAGMPMRFLVAVVDITHDKTVN